MTNDRRADEDAIHVLINRQVKGWAAGDSAAYASVFTANADYVTFLGAHHQGRDAIAASYAPLFKRFLKGSRLDVEVTQLRFLTPDVAVIHAKAAVVKGKRRPRNYRVNTTVAVRTEDGWRFSSSQNTTHRRLAEKLLGALAS
ncbi:SgcJ/EcaC family oxidoreductase [Mycobacterium sp. pUA109]|uniref:SgcJ/EcaC family oxidoreductase n=1 Tax=Mycobacterium sp. pUA109 TaxID=3238982 RepID=UPI00351BBD87